jgi:RNA polymerase sigma-70 factor (ECF subfamily)
MALLCLSAARLPSRTDAQGRLQRLHEQDRSRWDGALIQRGMIHLRKASVGGEVSPYHLEAGIAACHSLAPDDAGTDWPRILQLYDQLLAIQPSPVVAMNRAVAVSRVHGAKAAMEALDAIGTHGAMAQSHLFHMIRAHLWVQLGSTGAALQSMRRAASLAHQPVEHQFIAQRMEELEPMAQCPAQAKER